jgi:hypothetical protein
LQKQIKLSKRVSDLEFKLASARKELHTVLHQDVPPVPPLAAFQLPTPTPDTTRQMPQTYSNSSVSPDPQGSTPAPSQKPTTSKIIKKRKVNIDDDDVADPSYKPVPTDTESEPDLSMSASEPEQRTVKRVKSQSKKKVKRQSSRLTKPRSKSDLRREEEAMTIVPDGKKVPMVPAIPNGVEGKKAKIRDDGYGGFGHEIF